MKVVAIHVAAASLLPMRPLDAVVAEAGKGLVGDGYHGTWHRHVTIQSREQLDQAAGDVAGTVCRPLTSGTIRVGDAVQLQSERIGA